MHPQVPQIQTCTLNGLADLLDRHRVSSKKFFDSFGLSPATLSSRNQFIPYSTYAEMLREAARRTRMPHLGLELSRFAGHDSSSAGALGMLLKRCATIGEAAEALVRYYGALSQGAAYELVVENGVAMLARTGLVPGLHHERILQDLSLSDFEQILRRAAAPGWRATRIFFSHDQPDDLEPYQRYLECPLTFAAGFQGIMFNADILDEPISTSDPMIEQLLRDLLAGRLVRDGRLFSESIDEAVDTLLPTGLCCVQWIADIFGIHTRTVHRRLKTENITFAEILDKRRRTNTEGYLRNTSMSLNDIAAAVGYSDPAAFIRAFRRWNGTTPSAWREGLSDGGQQ